MLQEIIIVVLFIGAIIYVGRKIYTGTFSHKHKEGCDKCEPEKK